MAVALLVPERVEILLTVICPVSLATAPLTNRTNTLVSVTCLNLVRHHFRSVVLNLFDSQSTEIFKGLFCFITLFLISRFLVVPPFQNCWFNVKIFLNAAKRGVH